MSTYALTNANTGEVEQTFTTLTQDQLREVIDRADQAYTTWQDTPLTERAAVLRAFADLLEEKIDELADIIGREMGKLLPQGKAEVKKVARTARWFADNAAVHLAPTRLEAAGAEHSYVAHKPLGVLLGIMPWNFPYNQLARFTLPNLMVGNAIIMKQAAICPVSSQKFQELLEEAGLPAGVYTNVYMDTEDSEMVLEDFRIKGVSLTGSEKAGAAVASIAAKNLKRQVLELGGNDPFVVLDSSDIASVARQAVTFRLANAGQVCTSPKRIIVLEEHYDAFLAAATEAVENITVGAYDDPEADMGPLSSEAARDTILEQIEKAVADGATLVTGGQKLDRPGWFMSPALLTDAAVDSDAGQEEIFGPVVNIFKAKDEEDALRIANSTEFGLMASVWTEDLEKGRRFAEKIKAGMTLVNTHMESEPKFPFGGINRSGYGRENERWGLLAFTNEQLVRVHTHK